MIFSGRHDFTQFANLMPTEEFRNPVKDIQRCEVVDMLDGFRIEVRRGIAANRLEAKPARFAACGCRFLHCLPVLSGCHAHSSECTVTNTTQFWPPSADVPPLQFEASGFLYKQVRHMVGAMLTVGWGRLSLEDISTALELGNARPPGVHAHCGCCFQCHLNPPVVYSPCQLQQSPSTEGTTFLKIDDPPFMQAMLTAAGTSQRPRGCASYAWTILITATWMRCYTLNVSSVRQHCLPVESGIQRPAQTCLSEMYFRGPEGIFKKKASRGHHQVWM